jgi:hypothetical protein
MYSIPGYLGSASMLLTIIDVKWKYINLHSYFVTSQHDPLSLECTKVYSDYVEKKHSTIILQPVYSEYRSYIVEYLSCRVLS